MSDMYFEDLPSTKTPLRANNLNKLNDVKVSSTAPTTGEKVWFKTGKNLFDKNNGIVKGSFLTSNGGIGSDTNLFYQEKYIPVNPNTSYTMSATTGEPYRIAQYNSNKGFISRLLNNNSNKNYTFTTDANCHYIRISSTISNLDSIQVEYGNTATTYENYIEKDIYILNENKVYVPYMKEDIFESKIVVKGSYTTTDVIPSKTPTSINITLPVDLELSNDNYIILATADGDANYGNWITVTRTRKTIVDNNRIEITLFNLGDGPTTGKIDIKYVIIKK